MLQSLYCSGKEDRGLHDKNRGELSTPFLCEKSKKTCYNVCAKGGTTMNLKTATEIYRKKDIKTEGKKRTKMLDFQGKSGGKITEYTFPQK